MMVDLQFGAYPFRVGLKAQLILARGTVPGKRFSSFFRPERAAKKEEVVRQNNRMVDWENGGKIKCSMPSASSLLKGQKKVPPGGIKGAYLIIKTILKGIELLAFEDFSSEPCIYESCSIACQLGE
jgi:hypothetical protein